MGEEEKSTQNNQNHSIFDSIIGLLARGLLYIVNVFAFTGDLLRLAFLAVIQLVMLLAQSITGLIFGLADMTGSIVDGFLNYLKDGFIALYTRISKVFKAIGNIFSVSYKQPKDRKSDEDEPKETITVQDAQEKMRIEEERREKQTSYLEPKAYSEASEQKKSGVDWKMFRMRFRYFLFGLFAAFVIIFAERSYSFVTSLPNPKLIGNVNFPVSTQIYDRNGNLLYDVFRDQDRTPVVLDELPEHVVQATLSIEDRNFYNHNGISLIGGILRAIKDTYRTGELQGGSTITQQLVKSSLLTPERTIQRKVREAILALWAERLFTKNEILEMYLNQVAYGGTAYGIEEAAKTFFDKSARELTLNESAFLAGLTRAPSTYSPYLDPQLAVERRNEVFMSMVETGYLSQEQFRQEIEKPLDVEPPKTFIRAPHFVFHVLSELQDEYGVRRVEEGGLRITTTLDIELQEQVEDILDEELEKVEGLNVTNGAVLVTAPSTGEILAMAGSRNYFQEPYGAFNVTTARRQPGSSIKPLLYSLAIESGQYTPATIINDSPVIFDIPGSRPYQPVNYDNTFHGPVPLRYAMANSYNIPAVKVINELGVQNFRDHAEKLGISTWDTPDRYGLSLALGGAEVKMTDMAVAFGVFANYGTKVDLNPILSIEDFRGDTLEQFSISAEENVLSPQTSFIMADMMSDNFARRFAFGTQSDLYIPGHKVAAKTGTTNDKRDNWTNGFTRKYFVGVWVGNNDNTPMNPVLTSGVTGASPIWNRVMTYVIDKDIQLSTDLQPPSQFSIPQGIVTRTCYFNRIEYFIEGTQINCGGRIFGTPSPRPTQSNDAVDNVPAENVGPEIIEQNQ